MFRFPGAPGAHYDPSRDIKDKVEAALLKAAKDREENLRGLHEKNALEQLRTNPSPGYHIARRIEMLRDRELGVGNLAIVLQVVTAWMHDRAHGDACPSAVHSDETVRAIVRDAWARIHSALSSYEAHENEVWTEIECASAGLHMTESGEHGRRPPQPIDAVDACVRALRARDLQEI